MDLERLDALLDRFPSRRIAVIGDFFLDRYLDIDPALAEKSIETGKTAHQVVGVRSNPGAAGTVVNNLVALEAGEVSLYGFTGDDGEGYELRQALAKHGCSIDGLLRLSDRRTSVYLKPRDRDEPGLEGEHDRYDTKNRDPVPDSVIGEILAELEEQLPELHAVIIADQVDENDCGVITKLARERFAELATRFPKTTFFADSRKRIHLFRNVITKPNQSEAIAAAGFPDDGDVSVERVIEAGKSQQARTNAPVFVTRAEEGMIVFDDDIQTIVLGVHVDGPMDPTGAGDSATAGAVLALACGATYAEAALIGNLVASITVEILGDTGTATPDQVRHRLLRWHAQRKTE